jgi:hypothetical protein
MKVKELLKIIPTYEGCYDITIHYKTELRKGRNGLYYGYGHLYLYNLKNYNKDNKYISYNGELRYAHPIKTIKRLLNCDVDYITSGRGLANGETDERLQVYLKNDDFLKMYKIKETLSGKILTDKITYEEANKILGDVRKNDNFKEIVQFLEIIKDD